MPTQTAEGKFTVIDTDPHASRVLRYMRPSDVAVLAASTAIGPGLLLAFERIDPTRSHMRPALKVATILGFTGGFLLAYQRSTFRFYGWTENAREQEKDLVELSKRVREGKPIYGESDLDAHIQGVAYRNSAWSQLKFSIMPWFNLVNHPHHGVDVAKYGTRDTPSSS